MSRHPQILSAREAFLVVVDVQERMNAVMASQAHLPRIEALIQGFVALGLPVQMAEQYPQGLGSTVASVAALHDQAPLIKETFSCACDHAFLQAVSALGRRQALIVGIEAHVCVLQTALDLLHLGYRVQVPHDSVQSRRSSDRDHALQRMSAAGVAVTSTESALFELLERAGSPVFKTVSGLIKEIEV